MSLIGITNFALSVVPSEDAHGSEYVAVHDKRREWISGYALSPNMLYLC